MSGIPEVSVVIPAYNSRSTLEHSIRSVLEQSFSCFELIVVDDGSTDATAELVQGCDNQRVRFFQHECNRGAAAARNTGIKNARGQFVAFLDSDDRWLPGKLETQVRFLHSETEIMACTTAYYRVDEEGWGEEICPRVSSWEDYLLIACDFGPGSTLVARRECFEQVGLQDEDLPRQEDWDWLLRFVAVYPDGLAVVPEPLAIVIPGERAGSAEVEKANLGLLSRHGELYRRHGFFGSRARADLLRQIGFFYYLEGNRGKMVEYYLKTLRAYFIPRLRDVCLVVDALLGTRFRLQLDRKSQSKKRRVRIPLQR